MTKDLQDSTFNKGIIDMIATTIQHQCTLLEIDSMFAEAEENLDSIHQNLGVNPMTREHAFRLYSKMTSAQKKYDSHFGKWKFSDYEKEKMNVTRPLAYQLAAYHVFIQHNQSVLEEAGVILEKNYDRTKDLAVLVCVEDRPISSHAKTPGEKVAETGIWPYR